MGLNPSLMWLRGDGGFQSFNQGMGVTPWMQPRVDASMLGMQNDIYQAMAAAAMQDMNPSKQILSSIMQFQQPPNRQAGLMQSQILQQSQCSAPFFQSLPGSQSQAQPPQSPANHLQQQMLQQNSFNNVQIHHQQQQQQHQSSNSMQHVIDPQQVSTVTPILSQLSPNYQTQSHSMQSMSPMHHNFPDSNVKPAIGNTSSPLHSLMSSVTQDEASNLLNVPRSNNLLSSNGWPTKRVALDPLPNGLSQAMSPRVDHLGSSNTNTAHNHVSLPPFPGRECLIEHEGNNDPHNNFLFGVNIDSSSLLMQNGMSNLKTVGDGDNTNMPFASSSYMTTSAADYQLNPTVTSSSCIDESGFLMSSDNMGNANPPNRTFVKVSWSYS